MIPLVRPNQKISESTRLILALGWLAMFILSWATILPHMTPLIPSVSEVLAGAAHTWDQGVLFQLISSLSVSLTAIFWAAVIGLSLSYLSTIPLFRAPVRFVGSMRVLSLAGISLIFVLTTPNSHWLKIATLTFSIVVFLVNSMLQVIDDIPQEKFDHARTLGLSQWQVLREVVIRGKLSNAFDTLRMNAAMAWMMLTMVEANARSDGGIGIVLIDADRLKQYGVIFAVQIMILMVGLGQDWLICQAKVMACPYTKGR